MALNTAMKSNYKLVLSLIVILGASAFAEYPNPGVIRGTVVDGTTNTPIEYANAGLYRVKDSSLVTGSVSGKGGEFFVPNVPDGNYYLKLSFIGYKNLYVSNLNVSKEKREFVLESKKLQPAGVVTGTAEVIGERAAEEFKLDKKVINVSQNLNATGGTALDVLQNQSSVQIDADGNVTLRGSQNFTVLVNNRPGPLQGADALRQIPANLIESIEIISNPSAKYDAEGAAGIINLVLKKQKDSSTSGVLNTGAGSHDKYSTDFTMNVRNDNYTLSLGADYRKNTNPMDQNVRRETYLANETDFNSMVLKGNFARENYTVRLGIDYTIDSTSGFSLNGSGGGINVARNLRTNIHNTAGNAEIFHAVNDRYDLDGHFINTSFFYSKKFNPRLDELTFEATYNNVKLPLEQTHDEFVADDLYSNWQSNPGMRKFKDDTKRYDGRIKLNYAYNFNAQSKLETGLQTNYYSRIFDVTNQVYDYAAAAWLTTTDITNKFDYHNNVYAGFAQYSNNIFDLDVQAGLRAEHTNRKLAQTTLGNDYTYNKTDLFPSASVMKKFDPSMTLQFSYSRRINRPNEQSLNPYPYYQDQFFTNKGNPDLIPEITDSYELNYQKIFTGLTVSVESYFRSTANDINQTFTVDNTGRMISTFTNFHKVEIAGSDISASVTATPWLKLDPAVSLYNTTLDGQLTSAQSAGSMFSFTSRLMTTLILSPETRFQIMANYIGKQLTPQFDLKPFLMLNVTLRQEFMEKSLVVTLQAQNLFKTMKYDITTLGDNFKSNALVRPESPVINLSVSYNFNNFKKSARGPEKVDVPVGDGI